MSLLASGRHAGDSTGRPPAAPTRRRRAPRRRFLLYCAAPLSLVLVVCALRLLASVWLAQHGTAAYRDGSYRQAASDYGRLGPGNVVQRWVAPFDQGDTLYARGRYSAAEDKFRVALSLAPAGRVCDVRQNLSLAYETDADTRLRSAVHATAAAAAAQRDALSRYRQAYDATGGCARLAPQRARIAAKIKALSAPPPTATSPAAATPSPSGTSAPPPTNQQSRLQQRNSDAARSARNYPSASSPSYPSSVAPSPW